MPGPLGCFFRESVERSQGPDSLDVFITLLHVKLAVSVRTNQKMFVAYGILLSVKCWNSLRGKKYKGQYYPRFIENPLKFLVHLGGSILLLLLRFLWCR